MAKDFDALHGPSSEETGQFVNQQASRLVSLLG
jgi:hypothetical protein